MGVSKSAGVNVTFLKVMTPKNDNTATSTFGKAVKNAAGGWDYVEAGDCLSGRLVKLEQGEYEWKGKVKKKVALFIEDGGDVYKLDMNHSWRVDSLLNTLAGADFGSTSVVELTLYDNTDKEDPTCFKVRVDGERPNWLETKEERAQDYTTNITRYVGVLVAKLPTYTLPEQSSASTSVEQPVKTAEAPQNADLLDDIDDDLPF